MHHLTTLNLPTPSSKERDRAWLAERLAAAGAVPVEAAPIEPRPLLSGRWDADHMTIVTRARREAQATKAAKAGKKGRPTGSITPDSPALIDRARAMAALGLSRYAAARKLEIGTARLDRLCRTHGISFFTPKAA